MSSSTSNSNPHYRYVKRLLALALIPAFGLFSLGVYLQPLYGDLTRIGSYSEKEFGWNKPQLEFQYPLFDIGRYDRYYDVVVLGDSFSNARPRHQWQNHLVKATGWSVTTLDFGKTKLDQVLESKFFHENPPKYLILEWVERSLPQRIRRIQSCKVADLPSRKKSSSIRFYQTMPLKPDERNYLALHVERKTDWSDIKLGWVFRYVWHNVSRIINGNEYTDATNVKLSRPAPFSSINKKTLLVYKSDLSKVAEWRQIRLAEMGCGIEMMRDKVEANGYTQFVLMVAPDKLTAYADFIGEKDLRNTSRLSTLSDQYPGIMPRLDLTLISAIHQGEQDVYLPDDTHWGSTGQKIAAGTLLTFLRAGTGKLNESSRHFYTYTAKALPALL